MFIRERLPADLPGRAAAGAGSSATA